MIDHFFVRPRVRDRIRANPLGAWIPNYIAYLDARGHPRSTIRRNVLVVEHFGVWLAFEQIAHQDVTRSTIRSRTLAVNASCSCSLAWGARIRARRPAELIWSTSRAQR